MQPHIAKNRFGTLEIRDRENYGERHALAREALSSSCERLQYQSPVRRPTLSFGETGFIHLGRPPLQSMLNLVGFNISFLRIRKRRLLNTPFKPGAVFLLKPGIYVYANEFRPKSGIKNRSVSEGHLHASPATRSEEHTSE